MKYIDFYGHKVSKLIVGDNPFNGHSYIQAMIPGKEMRDFHTEDKILEAIHKMEELGINTMLPLADPYIIRVLEHYRNNGGKMNFIFQSFAPNMMTLEATKISMRQIMAVDPIGLYLSGTFTDVRFETGRCDEIKETFDLMKEVGHEYGLKVGFGTHHPELVEHCEREGWDPDFYMACMYNLRRNREGEESGFITGKNKSKVSTIVPGDRAIMLDTLKNVNKPIIAFKIFAGGQMLVDKTEEERKALTKDTYNTIFNALKPDDFAVMGIFQKYHDQISENVTAFNEWAEENNI